MIRLHGTEKRPASQAADYTGFKVLGKKKKKRKISFSKKKRVQKRIRRVQEKERTLKKKKHHTLNLSQPCSTIPIKIWDIHKI